MAQGIDARAQRRAPAPLSQQIERAVFAPLDREHGDGHGDRDADESLNARGQCRKPLLRYSAASPSCSSIRRSWLYFATRSVRLTDPVLICPAPLATARSAMNVSSVSPDRCEMIER